MAGRRGTGISGFCWSGSAGKFSGVRMNRTPSTRAAFEVSIDAMRPRGILLRAITPWIIPGSWTSKA